MNKKLKYALVALLGLVVCIVIVWRYVNKPATDYVNKRLDLSMSCKDIMALAEKDTASAKKLMDKLVAVDGLVKKITKDTSSITVELGDTSSMSSVICQIDSRHQEDFDHIKEGDIISIKGKISACTIDEDLGLGNTIQMNYCSLNKK